MVAVTMPVSSGFQGEIFVVTIIGGFASGELLQAIIAGYSDPLFVADTPVLVDARHSLANPAGEDMHQASRTITRQRPAGHDGKWAIVVRTEPVRIGLGRMAALTMESLGVPMGAFTEMNAALAYLRH
jgi:hypothetical protein